MKSADSHIKKAVSRRIKAALKITAALCVLLIDSRSALLFSQSAPPYPVKITNISFTGGIGRGPTSNPPDTITDYYRGYGLPGTKITITASMSTDGGANFTAPMYGDVQFIVKFNDGSAPPPSNNANPSLRIKTFPVTIPSGSHTGTASIPYDAATGFNPAWITAGTTTTWTYTVDAAMLPAPVTGNYAGALTSSTSAEIQWNNANAPVSAITVIPVIPPVPAIPRVTTTVTSLTLYWAPVDTRTANPHYGQDFYEYRVYYKEQSESAYKMWNGVHDQTLRGLSNNPYTTPESALSSSAKHFDATGWKYTTIPNLQVFTGYSYYIAAVDVFGNEQPLANAGTSAAPLLIATQPISLNVRISDGVTTYSDFSDLSIPAGSRSRTLREANTKVDIYTITTQDQPDSCLVWFAPAPGAAMVTGSLAPNIAGLGADIDSVATVRTGSNKWTAYLPTKPSAGKNQIIKYGTDVRFVIQLFSKGASTFIDRDSSLTANTAWNYYIGTDTNFSPQPVKILNNVLSKSNPTAYPSYYLTEDAFVSITVYDIKGRAVATLLDGTFRRGGINIKEQGWNGTNKTNNKLGIGLYYINIKAKSVSSGKIILNEYKKIVMKY